MEKNENAALRLTNDAIGCSTVTLMTQFAPCRRAKYSSAKCKYLIWNSLSILPIIFCRLAWMA
jgi:hypothetical protein